MNERGLAPVVLDDFILLKKVGEGGMSVVYKAHQISRDRDVAIKILRRRLATSVTEQQRLRREAELLRHLDHPNIVRAFMYGQKGAYSYIVMEYVDGKSLGRLLQRETVPVDEAVRVAIELLRALDHAHRRGVLHCDVKPDNVLVDQANEQVKLTDFGLANWLHRDSDSRDLVTCGTLPYMAPEQLATRPRMDARTDLYAVGATLYHVLTGHIPFAGDSIQDVLALKKRGTTSMRRLRGDIPPELDELVAWLMAPNPANRPASAAEAIRALDLLDLAASELCVLVGKNPAAPSGDSSATCLDLPAEQTTGQPTKWFLVAEHGVQQLTTRHLEHMLRTGQIGLETPAARNDDRAGYMPVGYYPRFRHLWTDARTREAARNIDAKLLVGSVSERTL